MAGVGVQQSDVKPTQHKEEQNSVIEIESNAGAQHSAAVKPPGRRFVRMVLAISALVVLGGLVTYAVGGASSVDTFATMRKSVTLSPGIQELMHQYHKILVAAIVVATLALAAYIPIVGVTLYRDLVFEHAEGQIRKVPGRVAKALTVALLFLLLAATLLSVLAIAANVRALDKVHETANRASGGYSLLTQASSALTSLQGNNTNSLQGLFTTVMNAISGTTPSSASDPISQISGSTSLKGLFDLISPITVGTLVNAVSATPQGILQLAAVLSSKIAPVASSQGLTCSAQCLNVEDGCICTLNDLTALMKLSDDADRSLLVSLYGSCILAVCFIVQLLAVGEQVARSAFQERLLFSDSFDRQLAWRRGRLQESNAAAAAARFPTPLTYPQAGPGNV